MSNEYKLRVEKAIVKAGELKEKFPALNVEVCGTWVWVDGDTMQYRRELRAAKLFFNQKKQRWYLPGSARTRPNGTKKSMDMEHIRRKYGRLVLDEQTA